MPAENEQKEGLEARLEKACENLWWSSEADYPIEVVWQPQVETQAKTMDNWVCHRHLEEEIEKVSLDDFFARVTTPRRWHTDEDKQQVSRLQQLKELLVAELSNIQVYRCGEVEISAYALGFSADAVLTGFQTVIVET